MSKSQYNNSNASLGANASFVGTAETTGVYVEIAVSMKADKDATVYVEQSVDQLNWDIRSTHLYKTAQGGMTFNVGSKHQWFRVIVVNGASAQGYMRMATYKHEEYTSAVQVGTDGEGIVRKIMTDNTGKLMMTFTGQVGATGMSAYQLALAEGFVGTESAWILSLKGVQGIQGNQGPSGPTGLTGSVGPAGNNGVDGINGADGINGTDGADGDSAYQVWLGLGNSGTQAQFIQSIKGASILVKGTLTTAEILALNIATMSFGDSYFSSDGFTLYVFNGTSWVSSGSLRGVIGATGNKGDKGDTGNDGESLLVLGNVATASALPSNAQIGHAYFVNDTFSLAVSRGPAVWASSLSLRGVQGEVGPAGGQGVQGNIGPGVVAKGSVADITALNAIPTPSVGDLYIVESDYKMYIYDGSAFQNSGVSMRGSAGLDGSDGAEGPQGVQGSVGSVGLTGASIRVISTVPSAVDLPTGYDALDVGKAHFISSLYSLVIWDGSAYVSSDSLQGPIGLTGNTGSTGLTGDTGADGVDGNDGADGTSITVKGTVATDFGLVDLIDVVKGDAWFSLESKELFVYDGVAFEGSGSLQGPIGATGAQGAQGYSFTFMGAQYEATIYNLSSSLTVADTGKVWLGVDTYQLYEWQGGNFLLSTSIRGATGAPGADAVNISAKGNVADASALSSKVATAVVGDLWFQDDTFTSNIFDGTVFQSSGSLRGPAGAAGANATIPTPTIVTYSVASGTAGGAAAGGSGAWSTRPLNGLTNSSSNGGVSLLTNVITMNSSGTYKVEFMGTVYAVGTHKVRLLRINGAGGTIGVGQNDTASNGNSGHSHNTVTATFTAGDQLRLEHWIETASDTDDLGQAVGSGENELYSRVIIEKLA